MSKLNIATKTMLDKVNIRRPSCKELVNAGCKTTLAHIGLSTLYKNMPCGLCPRTVKCMQEMTPYVMQSTYYCTPRTQHCALQVDKSTTPRHAVLG
jgi:hypothetical protein